jgi:hypothetical protein
VLEVFEQKGGSVLADAARAARQRLADTAQIRRNGIRCGIVWE